MPAAAQAKFLEFAAEATGDEAFGLHLAEHANPRSAGLLYYAVSAARTVGDALALFARYVRIVNEAAQVRVSRGPDGVLLDIGFSALPKHECRQNCEFAVAIVVRTLREMSGRHVRPSEVYFGHVRRTHPVDFERFFGCPVHFGVGGNAAHDRVVLAQDTVALPLITEDQYLLETLIPYCDEAAKERNTATETFRCAVENAIQKILPHGRAQAHTVAKALNVSVRTLARRLTEENTSYAEVFDRLRRSLAAQYLKEPGFTISQVAWLLGYEHATSFNHAFKRWTGISPAEARDNMQLSAESERPQSPARRQADASGRKKHKLGRRQQAKTSARP